MIFQSESEWSTLIASFFYLLQPFLTYFSTPSPGKNGRLPSIGTLGGPGGNLLFLLNRLTRRYLMININKSVNSISRKLIVCYGGETEL